MGLRLTIHNIFRKFIRLRRKKGTTIGLPAISEKVVRQPVVVDIPPESRMGAINVEENNFPYQLMAAVIIKNEAPYMIEWLEFHRLVGVQKVIIYNNDSSDNIQQILKPYLDNKFVELIPWPNFLSHYNHQHMAYAHAFRHTSRLTKWLAILDADEFLFAPTGQPLPEILSSYAHIPIIAAGMRVFGFGGHDKKPEGLVTKNFCYRLPDTDPENRQFRSIVQPRLVRSVISAARYHHLLDNIPAYDENLNPVHNWPSDYLLPTNQLKVNHYVTKSREEFLSKISRQYFQTFDWFQHRYKKKYKTKAAEKQGFEEWKEWSQKTKLKLHQRYLDIAQEDCVLDQQINIYIENLEKAVLKRLNTLPS